MEPCGASNPLSRRYLTISSDSTKASGTFGYETTTGALGMNLSAIGKDYKVKREPGLRPSGQALVAYLAEPALATARRLLMRARDIRPRLIAADLRQAVQQRRFQLRGVIDFKIPPGVVDDPIRGPLSKCPFNQQTVGRQLKDVRIKRRRGRASRLDFDRDDLALALHQVIRLARESKLRCVERFLQASPRACIRVEHA